MKVGKSLLTISVLVIIAVFILTPAFADKPGKRSKAISGGSEFIKSVVTYPVKLAGETVKAAGKTVKCAAETVGGTVEATGETLTGNIKKAPEIIITPIKGTAETAKEAVVGTVEAPAKAAGCSSDK